MNLKNKKAALLFICLSFLGIIIIQLSGCSWKDGFILWGKSGGAEGNTDLSEFFSTIRPSPGNPDSHYLLAGYYQKRGQHREAIAEFKKVISIDLKYVKAYNGLGVSYDLLGEFPNAIASYEAGLALAPEQAYLHNNLGYSYLMQRNPDQAIPALQKAISLSPEEPRFHNNLASAYAEKGQYDLAFDQFLLGGDKAQAHFNIAEIYLHKGIYGEAGNQYAAALRLDPSKTLARTGRKGADVLASIFGKTQKDPNAQAGAVIPEPPKVVEGEAVKEAPVVAVTTPPFDNQVAQTVSSMKADSIKPEIPVIQLAGVEKGKEERIEAQTRRDPEPARNFVAGSKTAGNEAGIGEWNYEMKMAILQGKAVPVDRAAPITGQKTLTAKKQESQRNIGIEISNGNGVNKMAQRVGVYLQKNGYPVVRLTNSKPFNSSRTQIYYLEGNEEIAHLVAKQLPTYGSFIELKMLDRPSVQVKILLGKDIIRHNAKFREEERS